MKQGGNTEVESDDDIFSDADYILFRLQKQKLQVKRKK